MILKHIVDIAVLAYLIWVLWFIRAIWPSKQIEKLLMLAVDK